MSLSIEFGRCISDGANDLANTGGDSPLSTMHPVFVTFTVSNYNLPQKSPVLVPQPVIFFGGPPPSRDGARGRVEAVLQLDGDPTQYVSTSWMLDGLFAGEQATGAVALVPPSAGFGTITLRLFLSGPATPTPTATATRRIEVGQDFRWEFRSLYIRLTKALDGDDLRAFIDVAHPAEVTLIAAPPVRLIDTGDRGAALKPFVHTPSSWKVTSPGDTVGFQENLGLGKVPVNQTWMVGMSVPFRYQPSDTRPRTADAYLWSGAGGDHLKPDEDLLTALNGLTDAASIIPIDDIAFPVTLGVVMFTKNVLNKLIAYLVNGCDGPIAYRSIVLVNANLKKLVDKKNYFWRAELNNLSQLYDDNTVISILSDMWTGNTYAVDWPCRQPSYDVEIGIAHDVHALSIAPAVAQAVAGRSVTISIPQLTCNELRPALADIAKCPVSWSTSEDKPNQPFGSFHAINAATVEYTPPPPPWPSPWLAVRAQVNYPHAGGAVAISGCALLQPWSTRTLAQLDVLVHVRNLGDQTFHANQFAGSTDAAQLEGFQININPPIAGLSLQYLAHVQNVGDTAWLDAGQFAGTRGQSLDIEGFAIRLTGPAAPQYSVQYTAHSLLPPAPAPYETEFPVDPPGYGDAQFYRDGAFCGTRGQSIALTGLRVRVVKR